MARLSKRFYSLRKFLTLCRLMVASAPIRKSDKISAPYQLFACHNPLVHFRLPTYPSESFQMEMDKVWALPRSLATTSGIVVYFLFLRVLRCFSSPTYLSQSYFIQKGVAGHNSYGVSPFGHLRIKAQLAAPRSLSQLHASFIGILRQGIRCMRFSNFLRLCN